MYYVNFKDAIILCYVYLFNLKNGIMKLFKKVVLMSLILMAPVIVFAQSKITGKVFDTSGEPVIGASVVQRGTSNGAITDIDGNFTLNLPTKCSLQITSVGLEKSIIEFNGQRTLTVTLKESSQTLDEVVVVGYGTQKKSTLTGSVSQIKGDEVLKGRGTSNVELSLQGAIPGLTITRSSSRPTSDPTITLRGGISTNSNSVLILIDGVNAYQWELNMLNPNDIESVSVLKDASASIYGAQAAGGVILVTTKRGKDEKLKITYNGSMNMNYQGKKYPAATGSQWAEMMLGADYEDTNHNKGASSLWSILNFTSDVYKRIMNNEAFDWTNSSTGYVYRIDPLHAYQPDYVYGNTWGTSQNITFEGGSKNVRSITSFGYSNDRSLIKVAYDGLKRYTFRNNLDYQLGKYIKLSTNSSLSYKEADTPTYGIGYGLQDFYIFPLYTESGKYYYDNFGGNNVLAHLAQGGRTKDNPWMVRLGATLDVDLSKYVKGLSFLAKGNMRGDYTNKRTITHKIQMYTYYDVNADGTVTPSTSNNAQTGSQASKESFKEENTRNMYQDYEFFLNYDRTFGSHHISAMLGNTNELRENYYTSGYRSSSSIVTLEDLNVYDTTTDAISSSSYKYAFVSTLGRLNYDYKGKYLLEGTWRHDGSSQLVRKQRWQDFSGVLLGWRISEESFFKENISFIDNLKLRGTWGEAGNLSSIGNYDAYSAISTGTTLFGTTPAKSSTAWISGVTDDTRTWERVVSKNAGMDFALLKNHLSGTFDYFWRHNKGMLMSITYPATYGATAPATNSGSYRTHGWEFTLAWHDRINKDLSYNVSLSLNDARTKIKSYKGSTSISPGVNSIVEGYAKNSLWVYKTNGLFQSQTEVDAYYAAMTGNVSGSKIANVKNGTVNELTPGSVRRVDLNGDNDITTADLYNYGDTDPHYNFGLNLGLSYKGFDFSCFFQGVGQQYNVRSGQMACAFYSGWTNTNGYFLGRTWTQADNPYYGGNSNAKYPVMSRNGNRNTWNYKDYNDINVVNNWYARCKSIQLGYTLPKSFISKVGINNLRLWVSGENLFDISNVKDGYDPETSSSSSTYSGVDVFSSTISFGIDLSL
jgi:TonB-linked SusC/RagA family outer membrane protein